MSASHFRAWCKISALHGIRDCYESKSIVLKAIWAFVVVVGCFVAAIQSMELVLNYALDDRWETRISTETPHGHSLDWPNMTICLSHRLYKSRLAALNLSDPREIAYLTTSGEDGLKFYDRFLSTGDNQTSWNWTLESLGPPESSAIEALWKAMSVTCEDVILDCGYSHGFRFAMSCDCSRIILNMIPKPSCFKIDVGRIFHDPELMATGYDSGGRFLIDPKIDEAYDELLFDEKAVGAIQLLLYFGEEDGSHLSTPIFVGPGTSIAIGMMAEKHRTTARKRRALNMFSERKEPCASSYEYKWLNSRTVSSSFCRWDCYASFLMEFCQCAFVIHGVPWRNAIKFCGADEDKECWRRMKGTSWKSKVLPSGFNYSRCVADCKDPSTNKVKSLTRYLNRVSTRSFTEDMVKQLILVHLFYEDSVYRLFETVDRGSLDELISQIGGALGVWTGLSIIGIFQAFVYLGYCVDTVARRSVRHRTFPVRQTKSL